MRYCQKEKLERIVEISAAFDRRHKDPKKDYGIHSCELKMVLKGKDKAVQFLLYTNWHLPEVQEELIRNMPRKGGIGLRVRFLPLPADVGYHSISPQYEGQKIMSDKCPYLDGRPCYYDGSGLTAEFMFKTLVEEGSEGVWKQLEERYHDLKP